MKPEIWWAVCWQDDGSGTTIFDGNVASIFDGCGVQVPWMYRARADAVAAMARCHVCYCVRKVRIVEVKK